MLDPRIPIEYLLRNTGGRKCTHGRYSARKTLSDMKIRVSIEKIRKFLSKDTKTIQIPAYNGKILNIGIVFADVMKIYYICPTCAARAGVLYSDDGNTYQCKRCLGLPFAAVASPMQHKLEKMSYPEILQYWLTKGLKSKYKKNRKKCKKKLDKTF
jgi:hypothetical protein